VGNPVKHITILNERAQTHAGKSNVRGGQMSASIIDVAGLVRDLHTAVRGEVRFDEGSRALYTSDASNYRQVPIGVVLPHDAGMLSRQWRSVAAMAPPSWLVEVAPALPVNVAMSR
jgi:hypothetical protein